MKRSKVIKIILPIISIMLAFVQAWGYRHAMNADGMSYLDIANAYLNKNFIDAINPYWSPFYSWLIVSVFYIFKPNSFWEFSAVHILNFVIFIFSLLSFNYFLNQTSRQTGGRSISFTIFSYTLFTWIILKFITVWLVNSDLLLSVFLFLAFGILISLSKKETILKYILLGLVLGLGYLTKSFVLVVYILFLISFIFLFKNFKKSLKAILITSIVFFLTISPYVYFMSLKKEKFTLGENGKLVYAWHVNRVTHFYMVHWQGDSEFGNPIHPTRKIFNSPDVYEFSNPVEGTYPPWYDPSYWYEGIKPKFSLTHHINVFKFNAKDYFQMFIQIQGVLILGAIYLILKSKDFFINFKRNFFYLIPALGSIGVYFFIYPEMRYFGVFLIIFWLNIFSNCRVSDENKNSVEKITFVISILLFLITLCSQIYPSDYSYSSHFLSIFSGEKYLNHTHCKVYRELKKLGIHDGEKVATLGHGFFSYWAYLGKHKVIAEIPDNEIKTFFKLSKEKREKVLGVLAKAGANILVAEDIPMHLLREGWTKIDETNFYVYFLGY